VLQTFAAASLYSKKIGELSTHRRLAPKGWVSRKVRFDWIAPKSITQRGNRSWSRRCALLNVEIQRENKFVAVPDGSAAAGLGIHCSSILLLLPDSVLTVRPEWQIIRSHSGNERRL
jgi:hypothetical protein